MKSTLVVGDVHLGSAHCRAESFSRFLDSLPADAELVLNGDILDYWRPLPPAHAQALEKVKAEARQGRAVTWIRGNNDDDLRLPNAESIRFVSEYAPASDPDVLIAHGHAFDRLLHGSLLFVLPARILHGLRHLAGRPSIHVAQYARRWTPLFDWLKGRIVRRALRHARNRGFRIIVCGHTHYAEDVSMDGIRYLNPGCWTEDSNYCVEIRNGQAALRSVAGDGPEV